MPLTHQQESFNSSGDVLERSVENGQQFHRAGLPRNQGPSTHTCYACKAPCQPPRFFKVFGMHGISEQDEVDNGL